MLSPTCTLSRFASSNPRTISSARFGSERRPSSTDHRSTERPHRPSALAMAVNSPSLTSRPDGVVTPVNKMSPRATRSTWGSAATAARSTPAPTKLSLAWIHTSLGELRSSSLSYAVSVRRAPAATDKTHPAETPARSENNSQERMRRRTSAYTRARTAPTYHIVAHSGRPTTMAIPSAPSYYHPCTDPNCAGRLPPVCLPNDRSRFQEDSDQFASPSRESGRGEAAPFAVGVAVITPISATIRAQQDHGTLTSLGDELATHRLQRARAKRAAQRALSR